MHLPKHRNERIEPMIATAEATKAIAADRIARLLRSDADAQPAVWPNSTMALALTARELRKHKLAATAARH
jgi:hypothetical protein